MPHPHADPSWCIDSSATNHITSSLSNLSLHFPYGGSDKVAVGNGKTLPIANVGLSQMFTQTNYFSSFFTMHSSCS